MFSWICNFFWSGDPDSRGIQFVSWRVCCRTRHLGGLGLKDLSSHSLTLLASLDQLVSFGSFYFVLLFGAFGSFGMRFVSRVFGLLWSMLRIVYGLFSGIVFDMFF